MRIGIDCRMFGPKQAGLGRYVQQLVLSLMEIDKKNEYVLFVLANTPLAPLNRGELRFKIVEANIPWYSWEEQIKFPNIIKQEKINLMHFPHWNVPLIYNSPFVVTIHDLIMYHYPRQEASTHGPFVYWLKDRVHRLVVKHAVKKAKHIFVTSEFTKQDVHKTLHVPLNKMTVIYQSPFQISNQIQNSPPKADAPMAQNTKEILNKFKISKPYVLYVGNAYPHKNLEGLLKAWEIFCKKRNCHYQLVLVGKENYFYKRLKSEVRSLKSVIFTDYVPDDELSVLYQNASLYVFPSLYEGFGLPPLEAMAYGVPVVSSNASCLPEVLGEAALYFDPENYEQMADVIYKGLTDENIRFELRQNAVENLKRFDWNFLAKQTLMCYNKHT